MAGLREAFTTQDPESTENTFSDAMAVRSVCSGPVLTEQKPPETKTLKATSLPRRTPRQIFFRAFRAFVVKMLRTYTSSEKFSRLVSSGTPAACSFSENLGTMPVA